MSFGILASLALTLFVVWFIAAPFFEPALVRSGAAEGYGPLASLADAKERALRAIKDLELDFSMGKLSQEDFEDSRKALTLEVATLLKDIQKHEGKAK